MGRLSKKQLKKKYQKELQKITAKIVKGYKPEKIILFGSLANDEIRRNSDIDLLIIKKTKEKYWDRVKKVIYNCLDESWFPVDFFVITPEELKKAQQENRFFITEEVFPKGKVIYEAKSKIS